MNLDPKITKQVVRKRWLGIFKILLALALIAVVFSKTSLAQIIETTKNASLPWLLVSFLLFWVVTMLKAVQYWALLDGDTSYWQVLRIVIFQNALSNLVANMAGVASYFAMFRLEQNVNVKRSGAVFVITKVGDVFSTGLFLSLSAYIVWARIKSLQELTIVLLFGIAASLFLFGVMIVFRIKFILFVRKTIHWLRLDRIKFLVSLVDLAEAVAGQERGVFIRTALLATALSVLYMVATLFYLFSKTQVFHIPIVFWESAYIVSMFQLISLIPIQVFGGLGVVEFTTLYFYAIFGIVSADIPATLIGGRILLYLFHLFSLLYVSVEGFFNKPKSS